MIRNWSYLNTLTYYSNSALGGARSRAANGPKHDILPDLDFLWVEGFTSYSHFKVFRKSIKFRKYRVFNSGIVRRKYIKRKRVTSNLYISKILKSWAFQYFKLQQLWRGYQSYGLLNLNIVAPNYNYFYKSYKNYVSYDAINLLSFSDNTLSSVAGRYYYPPRSRWELFTKNNQNSLLALNNTPSTQNYLLKHTHVNASVAQYDGDYFPITLLTYQSKWNILNLRSLILKITLRKLVILRSIMVQLTLKALKVLN